MCNKSLRDRKSLAELRERLGLVWTREVISRKRLRWFGHVERMKLSSWARRMVEVEVEVEVEVTGIEAREDLGRLLLYDDHYYYYY